MAADRPIIGIDFDNTIVCYDALFHTLAREQGLIDAGLPVSKGAVRDALRAQGREETWIAMQGEVYGGRILEADMFAGVKDFFISCRAQGYALYIVSHKTRHPFRGPQYDLHQAALDWLRHKAFIDAAEALLPAEHVHLELSKADKHARIAALGCAYFIDDLPEFLLDAGFPASSERLLFDPAGSYTGHDLTRYSSWQALKDRFTRAGL